MQRILEALGWRQGSFVKPESVAKLIGDIDSTFTISANNLLVVASQSCDVASSQEEYIELSIVRLLSVEAFNKQYSHNRHPRILHIEAISNSSDEKVILELKAHEKIQIKKSLLEEFKPDSSINFLEGNLNQYIDWLAGRYKRPALPTKFDQLIASSDKKGKRKKIAKRANEHLTGIYVEIYPNRDIKDEETYSVNLLGIASNDQSIASATDALNEYADILKDAGMDVSVPKVGTEFKISVGTLRQYQRINFDYLSYEENNPIPPDTGI
ncbi:MULTISPECIES: hypothetical protein [Psychrobacter]|jgi:hypothetical protein|nr:MULTISPECIES: hypothetical protein [Psychrobacter]PKG35074.1 hypothetical protein CXF65_09765 [Psychrobacter sp. Sarcosine-3u-12]